MISKTLVREAKDKMTPYAQRNREKRIEHFKAIMVILTRSKVLLISFHKTRRCTVEQIPNLSNLLQTPPPLQELTYYAVSTEADIKKVQPRDQVIVGTNLLY